MKRCWLIGVLALSAWCVPPTRAAEPAAPADAPLVAQPVRQLLQDRNYTAALAAIDEAAQAPDAPRDYLAWLKGRALALLERYDEAVTAFEQMEKQFPASPWIRQARFAKAVALARKGDFRSAELIYRSEAEYLLSADRKQQIADIYLEFADLYFHPPKDQQQPDYAKALEFYQQALAVGPQPEKRIEVELLLARCQQQLKKLDEAIGLYEKFVAAHAGHALEIEARYALGECRLKKGEGKLARRAWQDLLAKYPDSTSERIAEAAHDLARTWEIPAPQSDEDLSLGVAALESFVERFPAHKLASQAYLDIARSHIHRGRYGDAVADLLRFLGNPRYESREEIPEARNLLGQSYQLQKKFSEALATSREYLVKHPTHKQWSEVQHSIVATEYLVAQEQLEAKHYDAARQLWSDFLAKYPLDPSYPGILYEFGQMNYRQDHWTAAIDDWRRLVSKFPDSPEAAQAQYRIGLVLEQKLGKLEEALEEYRKITRDPVAAEARAAIHRLTAKTLTVATGRVFRSDETPRLQLTTRNIESVTVRAYTVDLETYFRKMHLARGVEDLDIALINPDQTFEYKIPGYAKYQELARTVQVPLPGKARSGVMAVTLNSKTLEATTLVVASDLDLIVKSSRNEVFVLSENMRTGKPWAGVRLLVSDGKRVFGEGRTGPDGVFQQDFKDLAEAGDVRVFAVSDGHTASNAVDLSGVQVARGLADKGYLYTDRPAYRAGQLVHVRGCIRHVEGSTPPAVPAANSVPTPTPGGPGPRTSQGDSPIFVERKLGQSPTGSAADTYSIQAGKAFTLEVYDSRNRLVRQEQIQLSPMGTFHAHFTLPATSPQGEYRVLVHDAATQSYQGSFQVHEFQLEPVYLAIDTPRRVYYRGEEIEGTIRAAFYYGAPLAGREIRYQLSDDRLHTATTDAKGEVRFKLLTREFSETQTLPLVVTLPERNLQVAANFYLSARGFSIGVSTVRPVFVGGETFEATVSTRDAEAKPLATKLVLRVLQQTLVDGRVGERLVAEHKLQTAVDGLARQTLKLDAGGRYLLRAEGTDRFKNPISGQVVVRISGEDDQVRLRILADRHTYKVGQSAQVQLYWRETPALALVTFQGARVLDYRLLPLAKGPNKLEIPLTARLAPNFELSVAVMTDPRPADEGQPDAQPVRRFHSAASPFTVERDLRVSVSWKPAQPGLSAGTRAQGPPSPAADGKPASVRPGESIEVTILTTDPNGSPVPAEVSLALVEQSLLARFPGSGASIYDFFRGALREPAVRTTSSVTFDYRPTTHYIDSQLLAEQDRLEIAREEEASRRAGRTQLSREALSPNAAPEAPLADLPHELEDRAGELTEEEQDQLWEKGQLADDPAARLRTRMSRDKKDSDKGGAGHGRLASGDRSAGSQSPAPTASGLNSDLGLVAGVYFGRRNRGLAQSARYADSTPVYETNEAFGPDAPGVFSADLVIPFRGSGFGYAAPSAENVQRLVEQKRRSVLVLQADGAMQTLNFSAYATLDAKQAGALAADLTKAGALLVTGGVAEETGYWNPAIATDAKGRATVTFTVPERSTAWTLAAKGITADTLCGEATGALVVKKDLFGELKLPLAFTDGDDAQVLCSVHNDALDQGPIEVLLKTTVGTRTVEERKTLEVKAKGIHELVFKTALRRPEPGPQAQTAPEVSVAFELSVTAGPRRDVVRRTLPLLPYGMPVFAAASGTASSDSTAFVELPAHLSASAPGLQVLVGPTVERSLLDIVLAPAPWCQVEAARIAAGLETATSDLMAALALQKLLNLSRDAGAPQAQSLDGRVRAAISLLVSAQNDEGAWSWTAQGKQSDRNITARAVWAMSLARAAGYPVPDEGFRKALGYLRNQVAATDNSDYDSKALLLYALAAAGQGDFALANRLHRDRPALSPAALVYLALALAEMDRRPMAAEVLGLLAARDLDDSTPRRLRAQNSIPWCHSPVELRALYALAAQRIAPESPKAKELVDWLLAHRTGHRWSPEKATGPAALALCTWFAKTRFDAEHYTLAVFVNDVRVRVLEIDPAALTQVVDVPAALLKPGKQRINFQITGRGRYTYQCILGGFVAADKLKSTTDQWSVTRIYEPAPLEFDGQEIPRGFDILQGSYAMFHNPLTQLSVGRRGRVTLEIDRPYWPGDTPVEQLEYLVITEPLPSGATLIEKSVRGEFERFEAGPGSITFYVGNRRHVGQIQYELYGYLPGAYRAAPTVVRDAYRPEHLAAAPEPHALAVLAPGAASADPYRLTPVELYELGKRHFAQGDMPAAREHLTELLTKWNVRPEVFKDTVGKLFDVHLALGPPAQIVHYFEIIKEKWPGEEVPFAKILRVGAAYHELGEYERSYLVFRATVESSFARESGVAGFLEARGEFLRSVDVLGRLLREYPPEAYVAAAAYALAQRVYAKAPEAADDAKLRQQKVNRVDLVRRAWRMLESFLSAYPDDPAADQAAFATANALLELKSYDEATPACIRYAARYPQSDLVDSYWYIIGYCHFATGRHEQALAMCRKVAEAKHVDKQTGASVDSPNKWQAIYILGQIYHSLGQAAAAIQEYRRVEERFADAKEAILYFLRKSIEIPEVTTVRPGEKAEVELRFRNVAACDVKVYRIDLMKFSLLKRNLSGITRINLAGIRPHHEASVPLGDGKDYRDRTYKLPLPIQEEGAYLVVCRGDELHASGLVLLTPLAVEVQEDSASGRVRATVKDLPGTRYLSDVHVKVIGSRNHDFVSGSTDLRGVFVADGIRGHSTVIAQADPARYAFFRGQTELAPEAQPAEAVSATDAQKPQSAATAAAPPAPAAKAGANAQLLEGLQLQNKAFQGKQVEQLQKMYQAPTQGVEAQKAF